MNKSKLPETIPILLKVKDSKMNLKRKILKLKFKNKLLLKAQDIFKNQLKT